MRPRGFSMVEVLVALLILGIVITATLAVFVERTHRLQQASETILAYQALSNEAEVRRRIDFADLDGAPPLFLTDTAILQPLKPFQALVSVEPQEPAVKRVTMSITWRGGSKVAKLALLRVDTGGSNLW